MDQSKISSLTTEKDKRFLELYGIVPNRGNLLHNQLEGRKYFDSGDFALTQARRSSDMGAVDTGIEHPVRGGISDPSCPVPSSSNVDDNANLPSPTIKKSELKLTTHTHPRKMMDQRDSDTQETKQEHDD